MLLLAYECLAVVEVNRHQSFSQIEVAFDRFKDGFEMSAVFAVREDVIDFVTLFPK